MTTPNTDGVKKSKLVGHEVAIDPKKTGMYLDPINKFVLGFGGANGKGQDSIVITESMDVTHVEKAIKAGVLRVMKDGKDVTEKFGGQKFDPNWGKQPIVDKIPKKEDKSDAPLLAILSLNNQDKILQHIRSISSYAQLERLKELESMGRNPSCQARVNILDAIIASMKVISGVGNVRELPQTKADVVKLK